MLRNSVQLSLSNETRSDRSPSRVSLAKLFLANNTPAPRFSEGSKTLSTTPDDYLRPTPHSTPCLHYMSRSPCCSLSKWFPLGLHFRTSAHGSPGFAARLAPILISYKSEQTKLCGSPQMYTMERLFSSKPKPRDSLKSSAANCSSQCL